MGSNNGPVILLLLWAVLPFLKTCRGRGLSILFWVLDWDTELRIQRELLFKERVELRKQCGTWGRAGEKDTFNSRTAAVGYGNRIGPATKQKQPKILFRKMRLVNE